MNNFDELFWKGRAIGKAKIDTMDMWYMDAEWKPYPSEYARKFQSIASQLKAEKVIRNPDKGIIVELRHSEGTISKYLVLKLVDSMLYMRVISDEVANWVDRKLLEPWEEINDPIFYENELKKEMSFFHPLRWKKLRAIDIRTDSDDVLFEIISSKPKYAVVHLTWQKETSRKFPSIKIYKNWTDLYENRLLNEYKNWERE